MGFCWYDILLLFFEASGSLNYIFLFKLLPLYLVIFVFPLLFISEDKKYVDCVGIEEQVGSIEHVPIKQKSKFPQEFFPEVVIIL